MIMKEQFLEESRRTFRFVVAYSPQVAREVKSVSPVFT